MRDVFHVSVILYSLKNEKNVFDMHNRESKNRRGWCISNHGPTLNSSARATFVVVRYSSTRWPVYIFCAIVKSKNLHSGIILIHHHLVKIYKAWINLIFVLHDIKPNIPTRQSINAINYRCPPKHVISHGPQASE
jgi:hypothetical protein